MSNRVLGLALVVALWMVWTSVTDKTLTVRFFPTSLVHSLHHHCTLNFSSSPHSPTGVVLSFFRSIFAFAIIPLLLFITAVLPSIHPPNPDIFAFSTVLCPLPDRLSPSSASRPYLLLFIDRPHLHRSCPPHFIYIVRSLKAFSSLVVQPPLSDHPQSPWSTGLCRTRPTRPTPPRHQYNPTEPNTNVEAPESHTTSLPAEQPPSRRHLPVIAIVAHRPSLALPPLLSYLRGLVS